MKHAILLLLLAASCFAQTGTNITPDAAEKLLKERKDVVVLDIRTSDEFAAGHIAGAKNIDYLGTDFAKQLAALDKSKTYLVHCASGGRSGRSMKVFADQRFATILHLDAGFKGWAAAGKPIEK